MASQAKTIDFEAFVSKARELDIHRLELAQSELETALLHNQSVLQDTFSIVLQLISASKQNGGEGIASATVRVFQQLFDVRAEIILPMHGSVEKTVFAELNDQWFKYSPLYYGEILDVLKPLPCLPDFDDLSGCSIAMHKFSTDTVEGMLLLISSDSERYTRAEQRSSSFLKFVVDAMARLMEQEVKLSSS